MNRPPTSPPNRIVLRDFEGAEIEVLMGSEALILRRGIVRLDFPHPAALTLLRWMLWHGLHGQWAPNRDASDKAEPTARPRPE